MKKKMNIGIIGAGYVGLTTGICLASRNHKISIFDTNDRKITQINDKKLPIYGSGNNIRDWINVKDHCEGIFSALWCGIAG